MRTGTLQLVSALSLLLAAAGPALSGEKPVSDAKLIASAISAAPEKIGRDAAVMLMGADGQVRTLRKGKNNFTCMPDNPATPGPDPMCMDMNGMAWVNAWIAHKAPPLGQVGFMYMLSGGTDASNTDPYATQPQAGNHWIKTGPHVMIVGADKNLYGGYPRSADPDTTQPYIMFPGTHYEHLMAPVR
jgi:hypothetical protein